MSESDLLRTALDLRRSALDLLEHCLAKPDGQYTHVCLVATKIKNIFNINIMHSAMN